MAKTKWYDWLFGFLIAIALLSIGISAWTDFNLLAWITFGVGWLYTLVATIVAIFGLIGLITLLSKLVK